MSNGMSDVQMKQILEQASGVTGQQEQSVDSSNTLDQLYFNDKIVQGISGDGNLYENLFTKGIIAFVLWKLIIKPILRY